MMSLPSNLETLFIEPLQPEIRFGLLLPAIGQALAVDRCFIHVRQPHSRLHRVFCWRLLAEFPDATVADWQPEAAWEAQDPMFAAALSCAAPIFVEDIETASPKVLNVEFERQNLGHRALVHAQICQDGMLYGILQPCIFDKPRIWSAADRQLILALLDRLQPIVFEYVTDSID